ncbi:unnamed protein product [Agarophyton chilense]|eukprot:gb/GEZJ01003171.1/.p1 GENE.gb/GEZJ01003171.1/~~gb/GEZJ01003171.1/.p1  ORF type:complete len:543 (-),score=66.82 gb/GEZJ01003171.1/:2621-4249(-)
MSALSAKYVLSIDSGTTSTRSILYDSDCHQVCRSENIENTPDYPHASWAEHDPKVLLENAIEAIKSCLAEAAKLSIDPSQVKAVGITNQRETTIVWDRNTGEPLYKAIVWSDLRTKSTAEDLRSRYRESKVRSKCGLPISSYFSGVKLRWMMENIPEVAAAIEEGRALFGTVDTWLVWNLSEEKKHLTDVTNAGRTMMMNIHELDWDDYLLKLVGVSRDVLPDILPCSADFGTMGVTALKGTVISGVIGDQQSALVGQACFKVGEAKCTYGTGGFLIVNTGTEPKVTHSYLLTTPAYKFKENCVYSLEGSIAVAGSAVTWLRDNLQIIKRAADVEPLARSVEDTDDVFMVPAFSGFLAPYWREDARGTIVGFTQKTNKAHIARATLESITYKIQAVLEASEEDMGFPLRQLRVDGGAASNNLLMEMQADIIDREVVRPNDVETTAMGAAFAAGHEIGMYESLEEFRRTRRTDMSFKPRISEEERSGKINRWNQAVERSFGWVKTPDKKPWIPAPPPYFLVGLLIGVGIGMVTTSIMCRYMKV